MADVEHPLERQVKALSDGLTSVVEQLTAALRPPSNRPLFTKQLSQPAALAWWQMHRHDNIGRQVLGSMQPQSILELDQALSRANETALFGGNPVQNGQEQTY